MFSLSSIFLPSSTYKVSNLSSANRGLRQSEPQIHSTVPVLTAFQTYPRLIGDCDPYSYSRGSTCFSLVSNLSSANRGLRHLSSSPTSCTSHSSYKVSNLSSANRGLRPYGTLYEYSQSFRNSSRFKPILG